MQHPLGILLLALGPLPGPAPLAPQQNMAVPESTSATLARGDFRVRIHRDGLLLDIPELGLKTIDGPVAELKQGFADWFGVQYEDSDGRHEASGTGVRPDWARRDPVEPVAFEGNPQFVRSVTRAGNLEIETRFELAPQEDLLLVSVNLTNVGEERLEEVYYSREFLQPGADAWSYPPEYLDRPPGKHVRRLVWELYEIGVGATRSLLFVLEPIENAPSGPVEVPLSLFTSTAHPAGLDIGKTRGMSFGDYDADGWIDMVACESGTVWHNEGGLDWTLAFDLDDILPETNKRYGSSFADYNNDGWPDLATEPRDDITGDDCLHLLKNLGSQDFFFFIDVAQNTLVIDQQPCARQSETICWGDVNGDGNVDMFFPAYPLEGNAFLLNTGFDFKLNEYRFQEMAQDVGLFNVPAETARPEGAQFADHDGDGDLDLYVHGVLYQNLTTSDTPRFEAMTENGSGIELSTFLDEGAMFFDYDMDGDLDLFAVYMGAGVRVWESFGDGNFFLGEGGIIQTPFIGLNLGMSAEDWDNDGDIDFTTRQVFRRNLLMETGVAQFSVATTDIPAEHLTAATPAWGDWDKDGDLDCALGNFRSVGHFYENVLNDGIPEDELTHVRVRVVRDSSTVSRGLENEFGANVEIRVRGESGIRRRKFVASSHGYLNQNEYTLHFALPPGEDPQNPRDGVFFDVTVDFPNRQDLGPVRVDRHVNPKLGDVPLADLTDREITVYRSGRVMLNGVKTAPMPGADARLRTMGERLTSPGADTPLEAPLVAPPDTYVGIEFRPKQPIRVKEVVLDGVLSAAPPCGNGFNLAIWDVTSPTEPKLVRGGTAATSPRNRRSCLPANWVLLPLRTYRFVAPVDQYRATQVARMEDDEAVQVLGGLLFQDADPCTGVAVASAPLEPNQLFTTLRFTPRPFTVQDELQGGQFDQEPGQR